jgi:ADP-ribose pyrophosphatase
MGVLTLAIQEISRDVRDAGHRMRIGEVTLRASDGTSFRRRYLHTPDSVAIVATYQAALVLVREFRAAVGTEVLQVPMGKLPDGMDPRQQALAELSEESGFRAGRCEPVATLLACPGWLNQRLHVFRATDLEPLADHAAADHAAADHAAADHAAAADAAADRAAADALDAADDDIEEHESSVVLLPLADFDEAVISGQVCDARTIAAVYVARARDVHWSVGSGPPVNR